MAIDPRRGAGRAGASCRESAARRASAGNVKQNVDVAEIKVGQTASVRAAAFPGKEFAGMVTSIAPLVEASRLGSRGPGNRSDVDAVEVVVRLTQPGPLTAGMKVDVYFSQGKAAEKTPVR